MLEEPGNVNGNSSVDDESQTGQLFIRYAEGGGFDIYEDGDRYGYALEIYFSGEFKLFRRIYAITDDKSQIREEEISSGNLDPELIDELQELLEETGFFGFPERLPAGSPHEIEMRTPAENVSISFRRASEEVFHSVRANLGADRQHYPEAFLELRSELRDLIQELRIRDN